MTTMTQKRPATIIRTLRRSESIPEELARFRYQVTVIDRGLTDLPGADHQRRVVEDRLDALSQFQVAYQEGKIVGCVRGTYARDLEIDDPLIKLYGVDRVSERERLSSSLSTQLMVTADRRGMILAARLVTALYRQSTRDGMDWDFLDCNLELEPFFHRFGYRRFLGVIDRPGFGKVVSMVLPAVDRERMEALRSPFLPHTPDREQHYEQIVCAS